MSLISAALALGAAAQAPQAIPADYQAALGILGRSGDYQSSVLRIGIPRNDVQVRVDGVDLPTAFGFGGWVAMTKGEDGQDVMMGDLVLLQSEVNPVMSLLLENGLTVSALHNHFFWDTPKMYYMHVHGMGTAEELAAKLKPALALIGKVPDKEPAPARTAPSEIVAGSLDLAALNQIIGAEAARSGDVAKYTLGRSDVKVMEMGAVINSRMGLNSWASFYGSDQMAAIAGDVAMLEHEVPAVTKALRAHGLEIVAMHHHMTDSRPVFIFLHYWGKGKAADLARGFKAALDELGRKPMGSGHGMMRPSGEPGNPL
jgi:hypothetical protein